VSLEWNKDPYVIGYEKFWKPADLFVGQVWVTNDHHRDVPATLSWRLSKEGDKKPILSNRLRLVLPSDSAKVVDTVTWSIPRGTSGRHLVSMSVAGDKGEVLSQNVFDFTVR
jgi:beta-mannosidase